MIRVPRTTAVPPVLSSRGVEELEAVKRHYADSATKDTPFKGYAVYKHESVKRALNDLFRNKCAYCEMDYGGAPLDVEHFRPKSAIVELDPHTFKSLTKPETTKPGYYWLAAKWTNLLPSCIDCNRPRTHSFPDAVDEVSGKSNYFPLAAGTMRSLDPDGDCEATERRLLLDPCHDDPQQHLKFARKGTVRPRHTANGPDPVGAASIEVYGLQRELLVRKREAVQITLRQRIQDVKRAAAALSRNPNDVLARAEFKRKLGEIETQYLAPDKPFLALCRQTVKEGLSVQTEPLPVVSQAGSPALTEAMQRRDGTDI